MNIHIIYCLSMALVIFAGCRSTDPNQIRESKVPIAQGDPPPLALQLHEDSGDHWNITIRPVGGEPGQFTFDASLTRSYSESDDSSRDWRLSRGSGTYVVRIPTMTVVAGEEADMQINGPDGEAALASHVLIDADGSSVNYSVMIVTEDGTHRSSGNLDLSVDRPDADNSE